MSPHLEYRYSIQFKRLDDAAKLEDYILSDSSTWHDSQYSIPNSNTIPANLNLSLSSTTLITYNLSHHIHDPAPINTSFSTPFISKTLAASSSTTSLTPSPQSADVTPNLAPNCTANSLPSPIPCSHAVPVPVSAASARSALLATTAIGGASSLSLSSGASTLSCMRRSSSKLSGEEPSYSRIKASASASMRRASDADWINVDGMRSRLMSVAMLEILARRRSPDVSVMGS